MFEHLTPRQKEVALLLAQDMSRIQIAKALNLSPNTINSHLASIYRILGVSTNTGWHRMRAELKQIVQERHE